MAQIIQTSTFDFASLAGDDNLRLWLYNGLDCCATLGVHNALAPLVAKGSNTIDVSTPYRFVRAMQAPAMDMMLRGIAVQPVVRMKVGMALRAERDAKMALLDRLTYAVWGRGLNANSPTQMQAFFYGALDMPPQYAIRKTPEGKKRTLSCDHKALENLAKAEVLGPGIPKGTRGAIKVRLAHPFVALVTSIRDTVKKLGVVNSGISSDGRLRCSYSVAGPRTARWSSSSNAFGEGTNLQNITPMMRRMCCADDGFKLAAPDLEQAEARMVAGLVWEVTGDDTYWRACESGDLHTVVATMCYPELFAGLGHWDRATNSFIGDLKACREIADQKFYRHLTLRDLSKRIGHGTNFWGTAYGIAMQIGDVPVKMVEDFQRRFFAAFPAIRKWHSSVIGAVQTSHVLTTPIGRTRIFFGRASDDNVLREAIAHKPQSTIGELLNFMLYTVWDYGIRGGTFETIEQLDFSSRARTTYPFRPSCQLLLQVHDSIVFQYPDDPIIESAVISKVNSLMTIGVELHSTITNEVRVLQIPLEFKTGWNWGNADPKRETFPDGNPDGLSKYRGPGSDTRSRLQRATATPADWLT